MRGLPFVAILMAACLMAACQQTNKANVEQVDSLCLKAYRMRYTNIDTISSDLQKAKQLAETYPEGHARVLLQLGFVAYQQMDFAGTLQRIDSAYEQSHNQITLLCGDVLRMKVYQRVGDAGNFYESRSSAQRRLTRLVNEQSELSEVDQTFFLYAQTEFHFISSTYYYYQEQDSLAKDQMQWAADALAYSNDTTQLAYYHYMMGSGGLVDGEYDEVACEEFDHLLRSYTLSRRSGLHYFEANSLQAMANRLKTVYDRQLLYDRFPEAYQFLLAQNYDSELEEGEFDAWLPLALARKAVSVFAAYKDLFQTACAYRTLGEIETDQQHYDHALVAFHHALSCVNRHHTTYYPSMHDTLSLFCTGNVDSISTERRWIEDVNVFTVPEWMAGIRHELSLIYAAIDDTSARDYNRHIYLDILHCTAPNREMESRLSELQGQLKVQNRLLLSAVLLFIFVAVMVGIFLYRQDEHDITHLNLFNRKKGRILRNDKQRINALNDELEELREESEVSRLHIFKHKSSGAEKRAKVSLVQAVVPFLDRIVNEVNRMNRPQATEADAQAQLEQLRSKQLYYVIELADQIISYNSILTEWIKIEQGQLSLKIQTVSLQELFAILEQGHYAFDQQGVRLNVVPTDARVKADEALTLFMLNTLADNARKFTPEGGEVTIEARTTDDYVELSVSDTGCGMRPEDVDVILSSKVYDASKIGLRAENGKDEEGHAYASKKGHGFGLMNCKGIIEKYRKTASLFSVCMFGIESEVGKGSRFFFRLPRVMMMVLILLISSYQHLSAATTSTAKDYYQHVVHANEQARYDDAMLAADSALSLISPSLLLFDQRMPAVASTPDLKAFMRGDSLDYDLLTRLRNQIAIAALGLHEQDLYQYNNRICVTLYKLRHQDDSLPSFYDKLKHSDASIRQIIVVLVLLTLLAIALSINLIRSRKRLADQLTLHLQDEIDQQRNELSHLRFEENRFYVQNQVLDNCLSTIKHESMYYPARVRQLAERMLTTQGQEGSPDLQQLTELTAYYKQLYSLLISQAERETALVGLRRQRVPLTSVLKSLQSTFKRIARKQGVSTELVLNSSVDKVELIIDQTLSEELFAQLQSYLTRRYPASSQLVVELERFDNKLLRFYFRPEGMQLNEEEINTLFTPHSDRIPLLVVKQIIRDLDAMNNNPGLRLIAESDGLWFTLPCRFFDV